MSQNTIKEENSGYPVLAIEIDEEMKIDNSFYPILADEIKVEVELENLSYPIYASEVACSEELRVNLTQKENIKEKIVELQNELTPHKAAELLIERLANSNIQIAESVEDIVEGFFAAVFEREHVLDIYEYVEWTALRIEFQIGQNEAATKYLSEADMWIVIDDILDPPVVTESEGLVHQSESEDVLHENETEVSESIYQGKYAERQIFYEKLKTKILNPDEFSYLKITMRERQKAAAWIERCIIILNETYDSLLEEDEMEQLFESCVNKKINKLFKVQILEVLDIDKMGYDRRTKTNIKN